VAELAGLLDRRIDDRHGVRVAMIEHGVSSHVRAERGASCGRTAG
jgi:hypothetical protein